MEQQIMQTLDKCEKLAGKCGINTRSRQLEYVKNQIEENGVGLVTFVGQDSEALGDAAGNMLGGKHLYDLSLKYVDRAFRLTCVYGEELTCYIDIDGESIECEIADLGGRLNELSTDSIPDVRITLKEEKLKQFEIELLCAVKNFTEFDWNWELSDSDVAFLITNAVKAMDAAEKDLFENYLSTIFGAKRAGVVVDGMFMLNSEADCEDVLDNVKSIISRQDFGEERLFTDAEAVGDYIYQDAVADMEELRRLRNVQLALRCIESLDEEVVSRLNKADIDMTAAKELIAELEAKRSAINQKGIVTASNARAKMLSDLNVRSVEDIEEYNKQIMANLQKAMDKEEDVSRMTEKIPGFIESAWNKFEQEKGMQTSRQVQKNVELIYKDIEADAESFFVDLGEDKKQLLGNIFYELGNGTDTGVSQDFSVQSDDKLGKVSKVMLVAALPVTLFTGITVGVIMSAGAVALKYKNDVRMKEKNRQILAAKVKDVCMDIKADIQSASADQNEKIADSVEQSICEAYDKFCDTLVTKAESLAEEAEQLAGRKEELLRIHDTDIPAMKQTVVSA